MVYRVLAHIVVVAHLVFVLFVLLGGLLALRWHRVVWIHVPAAAWGVAIEWLGWICPLTPLENRLRRLGGLAGYEGGFLEAYVLPVLYPAGMTRELQIGLGFAALLVNLLVYSTLMARWRASRRGTADG